MNRRFMHLLATLLCATAATAQHATKATAPRTNSDPPRETAAAAASVSAEESLPPCMKPVSRPDGAGGRQDEALRRVREAKGTVRVVFLGDSITQGWEDAGAQAWARDYEPLGALQIGVGGDRTEHVLWRLAQAPLTPLDPEVVVLMIGTNNASTGRDSGELIVRAIRAIVDELLRQCPRAWPTSSFAAMVRSTSRPCPTSCTSRRRVTSAGPARSSRR